MELAEIIKNKNISEFIDTYKKCGTKDFFETVFPYINRGNYVKFETEGTVSTKNISWVLPALTALDMIENSSDFFINKEKMIKIILEEILNKYLWIEEKKTIQKIDRLSKESMEKVEKNFIKTIIKCESKFALRYGQEFFFRDKKKFYEKLAYLGLINFDLSDRYSFYKGIIINKSIMLAEKAAQKWFLPIETSILFASNYPFSLMYYKEMLEIYNESGESEKSDCDNFERILLSGYKSELAKCVKNIEIEELNGKITAIIKKIIFNMKDKKNVETLMLYYLYFKAVKLYAEKNSFNNKEISFMASCILSEIIKREEIVNENNSNVTYDVFLNIEKLFLFVFITELDETEFGSEKKEMIEKFFSN